MDIEDRLPGVVFYLKAATEKANPHGDGYVGLITLEATITDLSTWDGLKPKFDEMKIYTSDSFKNEMIEILQEDGKELRVEVEDAQKKVAEISAMNGQTTSFMEKRIGELEREKEEWKSEALSLRYAKAQLEEIEGRLSKLSGK